MPAITSAGVGSGIDIQGIIDGLMAVERRPLDIIQFKREEIGVRISGYGELLSSLSSFNSSVTNLNSLDALSLFTTFTSDDSVVDLTATDDAATGNYNIEVTRIAESHKVASGEILSSTSIGGGVGDSLSITSGSDTLTVDLSTAQNLEAIRDVINAADDNPGVTAAIINGDNNNQKLVLTANDTGSDNEITFSYGGALSALDFNFATVNDISGDINNLNAAVSVDGYNITRQSNDISDIIDGVTINLKDADPGNVKLVSVARDDAGSQNVIDGFVESYNSLVQQIDTLGAGSLASDSVLLSLENQIRSVLNTFKSSGTYSSLNDIGLSITRDGTMELNAETLQGALASGVADVAELFAADGTGFAYRLDSLLDQWIGTDGLLNQRTVGLGEQIQDLDDDQVRIERNLEIIESRYVQQFSALDTLVAQFQNTGAFLTTQLAQLPDLRVDN